MRNLCVSEALSHRGGEVNEDAFGASGAFAWVIDGATSFTDKRYAPGASDAHWYAQELSAAFARSAHEDLSPQALLTRGISETAALLEELTGTKPPRHEEPHGAVVLVRGDDSGIHYAILGDSALISPQFAGGTAQMICDPAVEAVDASFAARITELRQQGISDWAKIKEDVVEMIRVLHLTINTPAGIQVAGLDPAIAENAVTGCVPWPDGGVVLLATDGLLRLVDPFKVYDPGELLTESALGLGPLIKRLRAIENADPDAAMYPRLKQYDDATGLVLMASA